ncbi:SidE phosphodiesterase domain-containing protein [Candidatus Berkiella aquae]|uniref:SidE PDE domain-containing protein n=1 Tax=Candidatus Berkiella aquae TaxID=295108 RepID=A0A0Q9YJN5_9GAMM|nr:SidE phosphodiesterase domain-containing protein [Candidatus Berkiella aquae]MCS5711675.1 hypothetical protein [Candidatus Berkiella aquae]
MAAFLNEEAFLSAAEYAHKNFLATPYQGGSEGHKYSEKAICLLTDGSMVYLPEQLMGALNIDTGEIDKQKIAQAFGSPVAKIIHRPNHELLHSLRQAALIPAIKSFLDHNASSPAYQALDAKHLERLQLMMLFCVTGREDETGFGIKSGEDRDRYLRYRGNSAQNFFEYIKNERPDLYAGDKEALYHDAWVVELMGAPTIPLKELDNTSYVMIQKMQKDGIHFPDKDTNTFPQTYLEMMNMAHGLDLLRVYSPLSSGHDNSAKNIAALMGKNLDFLKENGSLTQDHILSAVRDSIAMMQYSRRMLNGSGEKSTTLVEMDPHKIEALLQSATLRGVVGKVEELGKELKRLEALKSSLQNGAEAPEGVTIPKLAKEIKEKESELVKLRDEITNVVGRGILQQGHYAYDPKRFDYCHYKDGKVEENNRDFEREVGSGVTMLAKVVQPTFRGKAQAMKASATVAAVSPSQPLPQPKMQAQIFPSTQPIAGKVPPPPLQPMGKIPPPPMGKASAVGSSPQVMKAPTMPAQPPMKPPTMPVQPLVMQSSQSISPPMPMSELQLLFNVLSRYNMIEKGFGWKTIEGDWEIGRSAHSKNVALTNNQYHFELNNGIIICLDKANGYAPLKPLPSVEFPREQIHKFLNEATKPPIQPQVMKPVMPVHSQPMKPVMPVQHQPMKPVMPVQHQPMKPVMPVQHQPMKPVMPVQSPVMKPVMPVQPQPVQLQPIQPVIQLTSAHYDRQFINTLYEQSGKTYPSSNDGQTNLKQLMIDTLQTQGVVDQKILQQVNVVGAGGKNGYDGYIVSLPAVSDQVLQKIVREAVERKEQAAVQAEKSQAVTNSGLVAQYLKNIKPSADIQDKGGSVLISHNDFAAIRDAVARKNPQMSIHLESVKAGANGIELDATKCQNILNAQLQQIELIHKFYDKNIAKNYHDLEHKSDNQTLNFMINEVRDLGKSLTGKGKERAQQHQNIQALMDYYKKNPPQNAAEGLKAVKNTIAYLDSIRQEISKESNVFSSNTKKLCDSYINQLIKMNPEADVVLNKNNKKEIEDARKASEDIINDAKPTVKDNNEKKSKKY